MKHGFVYISEYPVKIDLMNASLFLIFTKYKGMFSKKFYRFFNRLKFQNQIKLLIFTKCPSTTSISFEIWMIYENF